MNENERNDELKEIFARSAYRPKKDQIERLLDHARKAPVRTRRRAGQVVERAGNESWNSWILAAAAVAALAVGGASYWALQLRPATVTAQSLASASPGMSTEKASSHLAGQTKAPAAMAHHPDEYLQDDEVDDEDASAVVAALEGDLGDDDIFSALDVLHDVGDWSDEPNGG